MFAEERHTFKSVGCIFTFLLRLALGGKQVYVVEKECSEIELPEKKLDDFVELLHCMYPPIKSVTGTRRSWAKTLSAHGRLRFAHCFGS